eukprot:c35695_g1_i1 orf=217-585(-)
MNKQSGYLAGDITHYGENIINMSSEIDPLSFLMALWLQVWTVQCLFNNGQSCVDYLKTNQEGPACLAYFEIREPNPESDHSPWSSEIGFHLRKKNRNAHKERLYQIGIETGNISRETDRNPT